MSKKRSHMFLLREQDIQLAVLSRKSIPVDAVLKTQTGLVAGGKVRECEDQSANLDALKKCCDEQGGTVKSSSLSGVWYCEVTTSDSGTWDQD